MNSSTQWMTSKLKILCHGTKKIRLGCRQWTRGFTKVTCFSWKKEKQTSLNSKIFAVSVRVKIFSLISKTIFYKFYLNFRVLNPLIGNKWSHRYLQFDTAAKELIIQHPDQKQPQEKFKVNPDHSKASEISNETRSDRRYLFEVQGLNLKKK